MHWKENTHRKMRRCSWNCVTAGENYNSHKRKSSFMSFLCERVLKNYKLTWVTLDQKSQTSTKYFKVKITQWLVTFVMHFIYVTSVKPSVKTGWCWVLLTDSWVTVQCWFCSASTLQTFLLFVLIFFIFSLYWGEWDENHLHTVMDCTCWKHYKVLLFVLWLKRLVWTLYTDGPPTGHWCVWWWKGGTVGPGSRSCRCSGGSNVVTPSTCLHRFDLWHGAFLQTMDMLKLDISFCCKFAFHSVGFTTFVVPMLCVWSGYV